MQHLSPEAETAAMDRYLQIRADARAEALALFEIPAPPRLALVE